MGRKEGGRKNRKGKAKKRQVAPPRVTLAGSGTNSKPAEPAYVSPEPAHADDSESDGERSASPSPDDDQDEGLSDYKYGGYHPVNIGDIFKDRYRVVRKIGWGHFSTVWRCEDLAVGGHGVVALKIQKSARHYYEAAQDEIRILEEVGRHENGNECVVALLDSFIHEGVNGKHVCMAFEVLGHSLLTLMKRYHYRGIPLPIVRHITRQLLQGLDHLHRVCGLIHTDVKPENVLLVSPPPSAKTGVEYSDSKIGVSSIAATSADGRSQMPGGVGTSYGSSRMGSSAHGSRLGSQHSGAGAAPPSADGLSRKEKKKLKNKRKKKLKKQKKAAAAALLDEGPPAATDTAAPGGGGDRDLGDQQVTTAAPAAAPGGDPAGSAPSPKDVLRANLGRLVLEPDTAQQGEEQGGRSAPESPGSLQPPQEEEEEEELGQGSSGDADAGSAAAASSSSASAQPAGLDDDECTATSATPSTQPHAAAAAAAAAVGGGGGGGGEGEGVLASSGSSYPARPPLELNRCASSETLNSAKIASGQFDWSDLPVSPSVPDRALLPPPVPVVAAAKRDLPPAAPPAPDASSTASLGTDSASAASTPAPPEEEEEEEPTAPAAVPAATVLAAAAAAAAAADDNDAAAASGASEGPDADEVEADTAAAPRGGGDAEEEGRRGEPARAVSAAGGGDEDGAGAGDEKPCLKPTPVRLTSGEPLPRALEREAAAAADTALPPDSSGSGGAGAPSALENKEEEETAPPPAKPPVAAANAARHRSAAASGHFDISRYDAKIVDLGSGCWSNKHYSDIIQTRQYRSPEVILESGYDASADIWSLACTVFEMITGDYLFEPRAKDGFNTRDDDHLAQMIELLGRMPTEVALAGKQSHKYFNRSAQLKRIRHLRFWQLVDVLEEKYGWKRVDAKEMSSFLTPMLAFSREKRATAQQCLTHRFLRERKHSHREPSIREERGGPEARAGLADAGAPAAVSLEDRASPVDGICGSAVRPPARVRALNKARPPMPASAAEPSDMNTIDPSTPLGMTQRMYAQQSFSPPTEILTIGDPALSKKLSGNGTSGGEIYSTLFHKVN